MWNLVIVMLTFLSFERTSFESRVEVTLRMGPATGAPHMYTTRLTLWQVLGIDLAKPKRQVQSGSPEQESAAT